MGLEEKNWMSPVKNTINEAKDQNSRSQEKIHIAY